MQEHAYGHMLQEYYVQRVRDVMRKRAEARSDIRTRAQLQALQRSVRRKLRQSFGPFPARTPLKLATTGTVARKHCRIEKLIFESRPGFPVTANLYVPNNLGGLETPLAYL